MRTSNRRQGTLWTLAALCWATAGCLIKDAPQPDAGAAKDASNGPAIDGPRGGADGIGGGGSGGGGSDGGGSGGSAADGSDGPGGAGPSDSAAFDVAPPDLVDAAGTCSADDQCFTAKP